MKCAKCACEGYKLYKPKYTGSGENKRWIKEPQIWFCLTCRAEWQ